MRKKQTTRAYFLKSFPCYFVIGLFLLSSAWSQTPGEKKLELVFDAQRAEQRAVVEISPDSKSVLIGGSKSLALWSFVTGSEKWRIRIPSKIQSIKFSPDSKIFLVACEASGPDYSALMMYEAENGQQLAVLGSEFRGPVVDLAITSNGKKAVTVESGGGTHVWDIVTMQKVSVFDKMSRIRAVAISRDGKHVLTGHDDGAARLWDLENNDRLQKEFDVGNGPVNSVAFADYPYYTRLIDPFTVLIGSEDGTARLFTPSGDELVRLVNGEPVKAVASSVYEDPQRGVSLRYIAIGDRKGVVHLWKTPRSLTGRPDTVPPVVIVDLNKPQTESSGEILRLSGHTDTISAVAITQNEKFILSYSRDSTARLWEVAKGAEICKIVSFSDGDWAVITPEGRFDAARQGHVTGLFWKFGDEAILLSELRETYYEPNLLAKLLDYNHEKLRDIPPLKDTRLYPEILDQKFVSNSGVLTFRLKNRGGGIGKTEVYLNGKLVVPDARDNRLRGNPAVSEAVLEVDLKNANFRKGDENLISIVTSNFIEQIGRGNIQSRGTEIVYKSEDPKEQSLPKLYAIVSGVSDYDGDKIDLRFAAKDAEDFSNALTLAARRLFCPPGNLSCTDRVQVTTLSTGLQKPEEQPTKANFKKALTEIAQKAGPEDIVVIYLSGHGVSLGTDSYFYLTKEARSSSKEDLAQTFQTVAISSEELMNWLTQTEWVAGQKGIKPLKQVLILDTCAAGLAAAQLALTTKRDLSGDQIRAIEFLKDKTGTFILMGSTADAPSYEAGQFGQGLLTYSLLQGMRGGELKPGGYIDVQKLFDYAEEKVPGLATNIGGVQKPIISAPLGKTFIMGQMTEVEQKQIDLPTRKPLMLRPLLTNPETGDDDLQLILGLRKLLDAESSYEVMKRMGKGKPLLVYVDNDSFPGAIRITGNYRSVDGKVRLKAFLRRDNKTLVDLPEIVAERSKVLEELIERVRTAISNINFSQ